MHWIHTTPLAGMSVELSEDSAEPIAIGLVTSDGEGTPSGVPGFPLFVDPDTLRSPTGRWGAHLHAPTLLPLERALEAANGALARECARGRLLAVTDAEATLSVLGEASRGCGVRTLADRTDPSGVPVRCADPSLIDAWWDRRRPGDRSLASLCSRYGIATRGASGWPQESAAVTVGLLRALLDLAADEDGTLTRLGSGHWEGMRWLELRGCRGPDDLHRVMTRWEMARARAGSLPH